MEPSLNFLVEGVSKNDNTSPLIEIDGLYTNELPINIVPLDNQVAGHSFKDGKFMIGMLKHKDGFVLKPVNRPEQGKREIAFYESFQTTSDPILLKFKEFIPEFRGTTNLIINGKSITFLKLDNITANFKHPCVMDIKVGAQTWEPGASERKRETEEVS
uniref:Kinase n=1 Tax=Clastoptera arizonana TaxID=38151 RepID=A0A1B6DQ49_9HEMI